MGKISQKSSYQNQIKANKTDRFFANKQATKIMRAASRPKKK